MAKRTKSKALETEFTMFDVVYEDGSRTSNRRVLTSLLGGQAAARDRDAPAVEQGRVRARSRREEEAREIALAAGTPKAREMGRLGRQGVGKIAMPGCHGSRGRRDRNRLSRVDAAAPQRRKE